MKIVHFTHGRVNPSGESGMSRTVYNLNKYQKLMGHDSQIWSVVDGIKGHKTFKRDKYVTIEMFPRIYKIFAHGNDVINYIKNNRLNMDIVHFHMMWMFDKNVVANTLLKLGIPYVVTTHGAYPRDRIKNDWWKKILAKYAYELRFLNNANSIHALTYEELIALREFGIKSPIFVAPNGIELKEIPNSSNYVFFGNKQNLKGKIKFCWIGNLKPCKNIDGLIKAVALIPENIREKIAFILVGPEGTDAKGYLSHLKKLVYKCNLYNVFYFAGPLYGQNKYDALASSDVYIHPSWSEGISFALLDAMACGKPCVISRPCNLAAFYGHKFFVEIEPFPNDIATGIIEMINKKDRWLTMGAIARKLIESKFTWEHIVSQMVKHYQKVIQSFR